jgi:HSP20 family molecular chaperone IbpA
VRTFALGTRVDGGSIKADYKDGVLTLSLPKVVEAKPRTIEVQ